ncbi:MAG: kelch repeat-containing protein [Bryobacteraceae bacterium]
MKRYLLWLALGAALNGQGLWERRAPYPIEATEVSAAALNGRIYALCGLLPNGRNTGQLYIYDPYRDEWSEGPAVPIDGGADHCNVAAANGKLYVLGALRSGSAEGGTYEYDPVTRRWSNVGRMSEPRGASGVAAIGNKIYVAGGLAGTAPVNTFEVFDTETRQWSRLAPMPTVRDHLTAQAVGGKFYAIAGRVGAENLRANEEYDPASNTWRSRTPIPTARGGVGSGTLRGRIQVFGGEGSSGRPEQTFEQHEEYDPLSDTWGALALMTAPRHGLYGATLDGRIFTPSGGPRQGASFSNSNEAFFLPLPEAPLIRDLRNAASFSTDIAPGTIVALLGSNLSQGEQELSRFPVPTTMNLTTVRVNGTAVPLLFVSRNQINFHLPYSLFPGPIFVTVSHVTSASATFTASDATATAPGLFALSGNGEGQGAVRVAGTGLIARMANDGISRAARRGEIVEIYATGLGRLDFPPRPSDPAPADPPARTLENPEVMIGGARAEVLYSGLTPGAIGLYQINARIAANAQTGAAVPVTVRMGAKMGNTVAIAVVE